MFTQRRNSNMVQAAGTTLALIYHQTVYNLRFSHRSALFGLLAIILQSAMFIIILLALYTLIGIRNSPIRGDFMLYIMSGIFIYMTHVQTATAVAGSHSLASGVVKHEPLNAAVLIAGAACAMLYRQMISCLVILSIYHLAFQPITIYDPVGAMALLLLAWFSGMAVGMVFLGIKPWSPAASRGLATFYQRVNMFASGKMFVANTLPNFILPWFIWNPLFHLIDRERGFLFINYSPHKTWLLYPLWVTLACFMVALLINFTTRKYESVSWSAVQ